MIPPDLVTSPLSSSLHTNCTLRVSDADAKARLLQKKRSAAAAGGCDVAAADAMDVGGGRAVGAGRGDAGNDGGDGAPGPRGPLAARPVPGPPRHPPQAARLLPPVYGVPARPNFLRRRRDLRPPRPPPPPHGQLVTYMCCSEDTTARIWSSSMSTFLLAILVKGAKDNIDLVVHSLIEIILSLLQIENGDVVLTVMIYSVIYVDCLILGSLC